MNHILPQFGGSGCRGENEVKINQFYCSTTLPASACPRCEQLLQMTQLSGEARVCFLLLSLMRASHKRWHHVGSARDLLLGSQRVHDDPTFTFIAALIPRRMKPGSDACIIHAKDNDNYKRETGWRDAVVRVQATTNKYLKDRKKASKPTIQWTSCNKCYNVSFANKCKDPVEGARLVRIRRCSTVSNLMWLRAIVAKIIK